MECHAEMRPLWRAYAWNVRIVPGCTRLISGREGGRASQAIPIGQVVTREAEVPALPGPPDFAAARQSATVAFWARSKKPVPKTVRHQVRFIEGQEIATNAEILHVMAPLL